MDNQFHISPAYDGEEEFHWPTDNFTKDELTVIRRFLKELNGNAYANKAIIDSIVIVTK